MNLHNNTIKANDLPVNRSVIGWYQELAATLKKTSQRQIVSCQGSRQWCLSMLPETGLFNEKMVLSNESDLQQAVPLSKAETLLGLEVDCVVYDCFSGLNIDVLCMAAGLIRAGGVLILLSTENPEQMDDVFGEWQGRKNKQHYFIRYLFQQLKNNPAVITLQESRPLPEIKTPQSSTLTVIKNKLTIEQKTVLDNMQDWLADKSKSLFFLTADRGRGKSTALGLFIRQLDEPVDVVVTAASRSQAVVLLNQLKMREKENYFLAPDEFIRRQNHTHCLVIDEAAMLPGSILRQCIALSDKTILATTTGGYEGTGQGFLLKFLASFDSSQYSHNKLYQPVRWGREDLLEQFINSVLMLDSDAAVKNHHNKDISIDCLDKQYLSENIIELRAIYNLLISAHYRTRPSDLRQLMEDENQQLVVAKIQQEIVGVLLLNEEGGFDKELSQQVFLGKRRPQGHLFAQMMTAQAGLKDFACFKGYRIQRITVSPGYRLQGIARQLIGKAEQMAKEQKMDYLSSTFALDYTLTPFWKKMGFQLMHISSGKGKSTGRQTVAVIKTTVREVEAEIYTARKKIESYLPVWLLSYCNMMFWQDVLSLIKLLDLEYKLSTQDNDELDAFSGGYRGLNLTIGPLQKLIISQLPKTKTFPEHQQQLLIEKILLNKDWENLTSISGLNGRKPLTRQLRLAVLELYEQYKLSNHEQ